MLSSDGFDLPADFSLPTVAEIEEILALGDRSWTSLLSPSRTAPEIPPTGRRAKSRSKRLRPPGREWSGARLERDENES